MSLQIVANKDKDNSYRHSAMEVLTSVCEAAPNTIRKRHAALIPHVLQSALLLMTEMDDDDTEEWLCVDNVDEDDLDEEFVFYLTSIKMFLSSVAVGESSLDRISCTLGGKAIFEPFLAIAQSLLQNGNCTLPYILLLLLQNIGKNVTPLLWDSPLSEKDRRGLWNRKSLILLATSALTSKML